MYSIKWEDQVNGVWKTKIGTDPTLDLLSLSGAAPRTDSLEKMPIQEFPFVHEQITVVEAGDKIVLSLPKERREKLYGLGLNFNQLEIQQTIRHLKVDHFGGKDNGRTHAPVPFYVSSKGYGVFVNLARCISVFAGGIHRKENHPPVISRLSPEWKDVQPGTMVDLVFPKPGAEIIVFAGPTMLDAVRRFNLYCGGGCLPARHGLGFWHRVPMTFTDKDTEQEANTFAKHGYPLDVIGLEPGWHTQAYPTTYEWNTERFPDPKRFVSNMRDKGVHINIWENGYISPDCALGKRIEHLCGSHTGGWGGIVPDLTIPEAREMITEQHKNAHLDIGVSGYKLDECDGYDRWIWPDHASFPSGLSGEQLRQVYGVLFQRTTVEMYRKQNQRTYGLVRASNAGSVSMPYVIYNDYYNHRDFVTALCSSSFCGLLWTPEARSSKTSEEWLRRIQTVCLSPLAMINAWAEGTKPWSFADVEDAVKDVMLLRMRLLPYIYTAFARYHQDGTPPVQAMVLTEGYINDDKEFELGELDSTDNPYNVSIDRDIMDQFMLGPSLLVAPMFAEETKRTIFLPAGKWFDFYTGEYVANGPGDIVFQASLERIPLFARDGGIIPLMPPLQHVPDSGDRVDLEIRHYGTADGTFKLYDDDGETYNFEQGEFCWYELGVKRDVEGSLSGYVSQDISDSYTYAKLKWRFMTEKAQPNAPADANKTRN